MKKIIELALKSNEVSLQGVLNLVSCLDDNKQERAVMLLTENDTLPKDFKVGEVVKDGKCTYTTKSYNYLHDVVICDYTYEYEGKTNKESDYRIGMYIWRHLREKIAEETKAQTAN